VNTKTQQIEELLGQALSLRDASFVIYREKTLVEFKTDLLREKVTRYEEAGHTSWQIGAFEEHHCHVDLEAIDRVVLDAEPVSCQAGRLNYTIWFEAGAPIGNPYRQRAYFSVTLNAPYSDDGTPKKSVFEPLHSFASRVRGLDFVEETADFSKGVASALA